MATAIIGSPAIVKLSNGTPDTTFTPGSGASHIAAIVSQHIYNGATMSALSVGGNSFTKLATISDSTNNTSISEIWYCAGFSGSGLTVSATQTATWADAEITFISMSGTATPTVSNTDAHDAGTNLNAAVSCAVGDIVVAAATSSRYGSAFGTWANSFVSTLETASLNSQHRAAHAYKVATTTTETANVQAAGGVNTHSAALSVAVFPSASSAPVLTSGTLHGINNQAMPQQSGNLKGRLQ